MNALVRASKCQNARKYVISGKMFYVPLDKTITVYPRPLIEKSRLRAFTHAYTVYIPSSSRVGHHQRVSRQL